jgi:hypothetical protein
MNRFLLLLSLAAAFLAAPGAAAQPSLLDLDRLDAFFDEEPTVEVNLRGSLLRLASAALQEDEPETAALIEGLDAVTVRVYPLSSAVADLASDLSNVGRQFEAEGWQTFVRVRNTGRNTDDPDDEGDGDEDVWIYVREEGEAFGGLVVMALDPGEDHAAFVLIDGLIEPDQIGRLSRFRDFDFGRDDEPEEDENTDDDAN